MPSPLPHAAAPRLARMAAAACLVFTAACLDESLAPVPPLTGGWFGPFSATAPAAQPTATDFDAFVQAQGTYCDSSNLPCDPIFGDIGYIIGLWESPGQPWMTVDAWGVNARWYPRHFPAVSPTYAYTGTLAEHRLVDGRRRITAHVRSRNTFTTLYDADFVSVVLGADFFEYGQVAPLLGEAEASVELIVPADFVGYPDIMRVGYAPEPGMEVLRYTLKASAEGRTRTDFQGIPAGTLVQATVSGTWLPRLVDIKGKAKGIVLGDFTPGTVLRVKPIRR